MNRIIKIIALFLIYPQLSFSQSLTKERVAKIKKCIGKITIEGSTSTGTGFFISEYGNVLTCWHVIQPAITLDSLGELKNVGRIYIEMVDGNKIELLLPQKFFTPKLNEQAVSNDFCVLSV